MARDDTYTRTGDNFFTRWGNRASLFPIPFVAPMVAAGLGFLGTAVESIGWMLRGNFMSALTALVAGSVSTLVNTSQGVFSWLYVGNVGSGLFTQRTLGTHARALTEGVIGMVSQPLGVKPVVLRSYTAGIGSIGAGAGQAGPGYWATRAAQERGQDPNARWAAYRNGDGRDHVAALEAASRQQQQYRGA